MRVSIDRAGRVVIPEEIRDRLSLTAGSELEVGLDGETIRLVPARPRDRQVHVVDGEPVIERGEGPRVTDADVQRWRGADQR